MIQRQAQTTTTTLCHFDEMIPLTDKQALISRLEDEYAMLIRTATNCTTQAFEERCRRINILSCKIINMDSYAS